MHMYLNELSSLEFAPWLFFVGWPAVFEPGAVFWHSLTACLENKKGRGDFVGWLEEYVNFLLGVVRGS